MTLPIDRTAKSALDGNLLNGIISDAPKIKASNDVVYNTIDELNNKVNGLVNAGIISPIPPDFLFRQAIINGNFDVWQRGTSFTSGYTADRWGLSLNGSEQTGTLTQQTFTPGQTDVPNEPRYFARRTVTVAGTDQTFNRLIQRIESVRTLAGKKVSVSFYAKADSSRNIQVVFTQGFGTGGSPSAPVDAGIQVIPISTSWNKVTTSFDIPSIAGKTLGTNGDDVLEFRIEYPNNTVFTIDIAQVQACAGDVALPFQPRSFAEELALCQRYYEKSYGYASNPGTISRNGSINSIIYDPYSLNSGIVRYRSIKRITPTVTIYSPNDGASGVLGEYNTGDVFVANRIILKVYEADTGFKISGSNNLTAGNQAYFHYAADAEL